MKKIYFFFSIIFFLLSCSGIYDALSNGIIDKPDIPDSETEYIIFTSEGSTFSPVIITEGDPDIEWIWDDRTSSQESSPIKDYGSKGTRTNRLKVTPWSSLVRINIGFDGSDGGSSGIEFVENQNVSAVENLDLAAPYLKQWCSSYNRLSELDFSNFLNLDTIECFRTTSLKYVTLKNTPGLKRACFEDCDLLSLDLSDCVNLEDLRGALNSFPTIDFGSIGSNVWHICVRANEQLEENLFSDMSNFPGISDLYIWDDGQSGELVIPSTGTARDVALLVYNNEYTMVDFRGALQNSNRNATLNLSNNSISEIHLDGCTQITKLNLSDNALDVSQVDSILAEIDSLGRTGGSLDLTGNSPPSASSDSLVTSLEGKGWTVSVD